MKKKIIALLAVALISMPFMMSFKHSSYEIKDVANEILKLAQSLELPEDNPVVINTKELWQKADEQFCRDRDIIATVVYNEAGYGCSDRHMELVAAVVWNRVNSDRFPDTVYEVVTAPRQYLPAYADANSFYGKRARESEVWSKCQEIAEKVLKGEVDCPENVFFQANFTQGTEIYEVHETSYSITYFCYG